MNPISAEWALTRDAYHEMIVRARAVTPEQRAAFEGRANIVESLAIAKGALTAISNGKNDPNVAAEALATMGGEKALATRDGRMLDENTRIEMRDGVAVLKISGPLSREDDVWCWIFDGTSYERLARTFTAAVENPAVRAVLFDVDSPGGDVDSCNELCDIIYSARGKKPIVAYVGGMGCSGAYWLASACDEIVCSETAMLGSIGVLAVYTDWSKFDEKQGIKEIPIIASQSPYKRSDPTTKDGKARIQARIDELASVFIAGVARNRKVSVETVMEKFGKGDVLVGANAVDAGLADRLGSFEKTLAGLAGRPNTYQPARIVAAAKEPSMSMKCNECGASIGEDDPAYCKSCFDAAEQAKAMGLDSKATAKERLARATSLAKLERDVLAATASGNVDEALGRIAAGVQARADLASLRDATEKASAADRVAGLGAVLAASHKDGRLTLGQITQVIPTLLDDEDSAKAALEKAEKQELPQLLAALAALPVSAGALKRVSSFCKAQAVQVPQTAAKEPTTTAIDGDVPAGPPVTVTKADAASWGLTVEKVEKYAGVKSVADLPKLNPKK